MSNNLELWNKVKQTDPAFTKEVSFGRKFTSIDTYYLIQRATEQFGAYGTTWGLKDIKYDYQHPTDTDSLALLQCRFYYPNGEFEIGNSITYRYRTAKGQDKIDDEFVKKIETNTIAKALSRLGFSVDVFLGKFEDGRYVQEAINEANKITSTQLQEIMNLINDTETELDKFVKAYKVEKPNHLSKEQAEDAIKKLTNKKAMQ